jgi:hypothetical protein
MWWQVPNRTGAWRPTAWLRWSDSNSETSSQNIPLKGRSDCPDPAEFWPQRLFAFELRRPGDAARPRARTSAGVLARTLVIELPSLRWQELPRFSADSEMIRRPPIQQHHCSLGTGLFPQRERLWWSRTASLMASLLSPASAPWASAGFGWWRRDVAPARLRGVLACPSANAGEPPRRRLHPKFGRRQPAAESTPGARQQLNHDRMLPAEPAAAQILR